MNIAHKSIHCSSSDATEVTTKSFTRSRARESQALQGIFMKTDILKHTLIPSEGFHVMMLGLKTDKRPKQGNTITKVDCDSQKWTKDSIIEHIGEASQSTLTQYRRELSESHNYYVSSMEIAFPATLAIQQFHLRVTFGPFM